MIDTIAAAKALRARARGTTVCTTGSQTLYATALGFARDTDSFVSDEFYPGMEIVAAGFNAANNAATTGKIILEVSTGLIKTVEPCVAQPASAARSITASLPLRYPLENKKFEPDAGFPYFTDQFVPLTSRLISAPAEGGTVEETGLYTITLFGLHDYGPAAIRKTLDAVKARFTPGTKITAGSHTVRVREDVSAQAGQIIPLGNGWASCQLVIPWRVFSINAIAA